MSGFSDQIKAFADATKIKFDKVVRKICLDVDRDLVLLTPVDTGLARSSWFIGTNRPTEVGDAASKNGAPSLRRASEFASTLQAGGVFYIANNLPYIMQLEYGSSTQAPKGMARITVDAWQARVDRIVEAFR